MDEFQLLWIFLISIRFYLIAERPNFEQTLHANDSPFINDINFGGSLNEVQVLMNNPSGCDKYPEKDMDEHCKLINLSWPIHFVRNYCYKLGIKSV